jgi:hypothetical protein
MADTNTTEEVYLTPEERLRELGTQLIQSIIQADDVSKENRHFLFGQVSPKVFYNENYILFNVMYNFKDKGIVPDETFLKMYLNRNIKLIRDSSDYIDVNAHANEDEDKFLAYVGVVLNEYRRIVQLPVLPHEEFKLVLEKYKVEWSSYEINKAYSQSKIILYEGVQTGRKFYQGYEDSVVYVKEKIADIEAILDHTTGAGFVNSRVSGIEDTDMVQPELIGDFDLIHELNKQLGGLYTSLFYNIMAPTKGGKSKFTARLFHNIAVVHGFNVSVWAHEGGYEAWWAQLRAIHYEYLYIRGKSDTERVVPLSQKDILYGNYPNENVKALEEASRLDLFTNPEYGNFYMIDRPFKVETFIDEIETSVQLNDSKAVLIDYLQLIGWDSKNLSKSQAIGRAYQDLLAYAKKRNVLVMSPSQFTQEFMKEMAHSREGASHEVRTAGGESSEIIRTPDVNIALYASTEDLIRKEMKIVSVPSRLCEPFPDIKLYVDLCSCVFSSMNKEED